MNVEIETTPPADDGMSDVVRVAEARASGELPCGARRKPIRKVGWLCDGTNLVVLFERSITVPPVVVRRDLLPYLDDATWSAMYDRDARPFPGGDHAHIGIPIPLPAPREVP